MENKPADLGRLLARTLEEAPAVRLGECTVISRFVHVIQVEQPAEVRVVAAADAGQVFYGRTRAGTVYHIDTFHALGKVDHRQVANAIRKAVDVQTGIRSSALLDRLDLQTGTGGGRVSGSLTYGRKPSLRRAHANHVHLAAGLAPGELPLLVPIVASVEAEILRQGLEIRKVERVVLDTSPQGGGSGADLSPYASETDSLLRESGSRSGTPQVHQESGQWEGEANTQELLALARETLPPQELLRLLRNLPFEPRTAEHIKRWGDLEHTLGSLQSHNLIRQERGRLVLTPRGQALSAFLHQHLPELESMFRQLLRRVPLEGKGKTLTAKSGVRDGSAALRTRGGAWNSVCSEELDLPGTVGVAARRWCQGVGYPGVLEPADLVYSQPKRREQRNIVLVLDSSASMAGERLRAARLLAEHLILATRDKVAVIAFQEQDVWLPEGFTRRLETVERQLLSLKAYGLTPLAKALRETVSFIHTARARRPLVVLITDGIPTVPLAAGDPSQDALGVASEMKKLKLSLTCIGLDPNRHFLEELCRRAGGRLHIVEEMEPATLARLVHCELVTQRRRGSS